MIPSILLKPYIKGKCWEDMVVKPQWLVVKPQYICDRRISSYQHLGLRPWVDNNILLVVGFN